MKTAILQSNYIPWKGYFSLIQSVDTLILYEDAQFTSNDWRNRNYVKTAKGRQILTVPVLSRFGQKIKEVEIAQDNWAQKHLETIRHSYRRAEHFKTVYPWVEELYLTATFNFLSELNQHFLYAIMDYLQIELSILNSSNFDLDGDKNQKLIDMCLETETKVYVSGPTAKVYINEKMFEKCGIEVSWFSYANLPAHPQLWNSYIQNVSVLDLLFNCGKKSRNFL